MEKFEEKYESVLQNIEFAIVSVYRERPELLDYEVERVLNVLIRGYQAEGRAIKPVDLNSLEEKVYTRARTMCEWRLGREKLLADESDVALPQIPSLSLAEIVACLKRIRKSVQKWSQRGGRQGYLRFVNEFIA